MNEPEDFILTTTRLAREFVGHRFASAVRLLAIAPEEEPRFEWGRALVELDQGRFYLFDCDESQSNILLFAMPESKRDLWDTIAERKVRPAIMLATEDDPLRFAVETRVVGVDRIARESEAGWFRMCGLRFRFEMGDAMCVGTHLTEDLIPSTSFYLPNEVDSNLSYYLLA